MAFSCLLLFNIFNIASLVSAIPFLEILFDTEKVLPTTLPQPSGFWDMAYWKGVAFYHLGHVISTQGRETTLLYFCIALVCVIILKSVFRWLSSYYIAPFEQGVIREMRDHVFRHTMQLGMGFFTRKKKGDILGTLVSDVQEIQDAVIGTLQSCLRDPLTMVMVLITMLFLSWKMTLFTLIILPITGLFISFISKKLKRKAKLGQDALGELISISDEALGGVRIIKSFQKEDYVAGVYQRQNRKYSTLQIALRRRSSLASPVTEVLSFIVVCIIILYGGSLVLSGTGEFRGTEFIGFIIVFSQFINPIRDFSTSLSKIQKGTASFDRVENLLNEPIDIQDTATAKPITDFRQNIQFQDVQFSYTTDATVLKGISFDVKKGETVALVGSSGSGKSTIADLVVRFYDPQGGSVLFDGEDLRTLRVADVRAQMGYVSQEGVLFHDTVYSNIALGLKNVSQADVEAAAQAANAHEFIARLPQGYQTLIGERGTMLSGGQRQRIAIARAILRNPNILILDEATSNLDNESEKLVQDALTRLMEHRTAIVIAHRLSTIVNADKILVIDKGQIVESGTHDALMAQQGAYRRLYETSAAY